MLGLALEGGGAKGAYEIGAYRALTELGYHFDVICGVSIGAINAALLAQGDCERPRNFGRRPPMTICSLRRTKAFWKSSTGR